MSAVAGAAALAAVLLVVGALGRPHRQAPDGDLTGGGSTRATVQGPAARALALDDSGMTDVVGAVLRSVVNLSVVFASGERRSATGVIIDPSGLVLTNRHVAAPARSITATLALDAAMVPDGAEVVARDTSGRVGLPGGPLTVIRVRGRLVRADPALDLAVIKLPVSGAAPLPLGRSADLRLGQRVVAVGNALGLPGAPSVTAGIVSALRNVRSVSDGTLYRHAIQTDAAINEGNSGGPLVDMHGRVIGINSLYIGGSAQDIGFAVPIDQALPLIRRARG